MPRLCAVGALLGHRRARRSSPFRNASSCTARSTLRNGCTATGPSRAEKPDGRETHRADRPNPYRARVRWFDPATKRRLSLSEGKADEDEAQEWLQSIVEAAEAGLSPSLATMKLAEYGDANMDLALRGLELKTLDPYRSGWRMRVVPALGHIAVRMITNGVVDRTVQNWIADEHSRSTVKNTIAVLVRVMEQAVRDGIIKINPARVTGWHLPRPLPRLGRCRPLRRLHRCPDR